MALPARTLHKFISGIRQWHEKILDGLLFIHVCIFIYMHRYIERDRETDIYRYCKQVAIDTTTFQSY